MYKFVYTNFKVVIFADALVNSVIYCYQSNYKMFQKQGRHAIWLNHFLIKTLFLFLDYLFSDPSAVNPGWP